MKQFFLGLLLICAGFASVAQTTATFESFELEPGTFLNGSDGSGGFSDGHIFLPNTYVDDPVFPSWSGWAISATTDTLTPGFINQYSAITGGGHDGSSSYAVTFASPPTHVLLTGDATGGTVEGFYVTNNTYAYLSMLNGDGFAKKFGGEDGNDPDFFLLTIKAYRNGELSSDSVDFYLADYRFEDNAQDYIIDEWSYIDVSGLGDADSLWFSLSGSDTGQFGLNTPAYFCLDHVTTLDRPTPVRDRLPDTSLRVFPNPTADAITVQWSEAGPAQLVLMNPQGQLLARTRLVPGDNRIDMGKLPAGQYTVHIESPGGSISRQVIRQ